MALIIEGDMPSCCAVCCDCNSADDGNFCNRTGNRLGNDWQLYRPLNCPIVGEIPYELENFIIGISQLPREKPKTATEAKEALAYEELERRMKKEVQNGANS